MLNVPILNGLSAIVDCYDGYIVDQWGVLHNGAQPYPGAIECLQHLRDREKRVVILSNSGKRAFENADEMVALGFAPQLWDAVVTSGEEVWRCLNSRSDPWYAALGRVCLPLSGSRCTLVHGLDLIPVDNVEHADFLLNTGIDSNTATVSEYDPLLCVAAERGLPMVCANRDVAWIDERGIRVGPGAVAMHYESMGGMVRYHGKPDPSIYERCFEVLQLAERMRLIAVGDSLYHDIAGAASSGIDSVLITGGIHAQELGIRHGEAPGGEALDVLCARADVWPTFAGPAFTWE